MPSFACDPLAPSTPLNHVWSHTIGSNHALMTLRADWQTQMRRARADLRVQYVRFHGVLDDDMAMLLDEQDNAKRSWQGMGSPLHPGIDQVHRLRSASELQVEPMGWRRSGGDVVVEFELPAHAVAAVTLGF